MKKYLLSPGKIVVVTKVQKEVEFHRPPVQKGIKVSFGEENIKRRLQGDDNVKNVTKDFTLSAFY